jgi:hypothetical protein
MSYVGEGTGKSNPRSPILETIFQWKLWIGARAVQSLKTCPNKITYTIISCRLVTCHNFARQISCDLIILKRPRLHLPFKHQIKLFIRPPLGLRNPKIRPDQTQNRQTTKEKPNLSSPISRIRINHIRNRNRHYDTDNSLSGGSYGDGLGADLCG